jgi:hypothetical protein
MDGSRIVTCPLTGRVGSYVPGRDQRPSPPSVRGDPGPASGAACPFCVGDLPPEPRPATASRGEVSWTSCPNRYPAVRGPGTAAHVAYSRRHGPALTVPSPTQHDDWAAMLDVQQQLARRTASWSLVVVNVGPTAGASQPHPHGQVLDLPDPPPLVVRGTRRLTDDRVAAAVLSDDLTVRAGGGLRLVVPAVPYGPGDLRLVPEADGSFLDADPVVVAGLVVAWTRTLGVADPEPAAPVDAKLVVHDRGTPDGRWFADLLATGRHGPVAGVTPFVELDAPPDVRAVTLRSRLAEPAAGADGGW